MMTQNLHQCEFCPASFQPRAQVKNPRACPKFECQRKCQRSNEVQWRERNGTLSDPHYHNLRRRARLMHLQTIAEVIGRCFRTGATFLNEKVSPEHFQEFLLQFLLDLGIRKINKFWADGFSQTYSEVI